MDTENSGTDLSVVLFATIYLASMAGVSGFLVGIVCCLHGVFVADFHFISCSGYHTEDSASIGIRRKAVSLVRPTEPQNHRRKRRKCPVRHV